MNTFTPLILASSGGHEYLYGLFFLIVALVIGAATRHFLQRIPLPFTVLLLIIGLAMGALNRAYGPHGGHGHEGEHASHTEGIWDKFVDTLSGAITWGGNLYGHLILYVIFIFQIRGIKSKIIKRGLSLIKSFCPLSYSDFHFRPTCNFINEHDVRSDIRCYLH